MNELNEILKSIPYLIIIGITTGLIAYKRKGKNPYLWFMIGFFFGIFGLVGVFFAKKNEPTALKEPTISLPDGMWYVGFNGKTEGPFSSKRVEELYLKKELSDEHALWSENIENWVKIKELLALTKKS